MPVLVRPLALSVIALSAAPALAQSPGYGAGETKANEPVVTTVWSNGAPKPTEEDRAFEVSRRVPFDIFGIDSDAAAATDASYVRSDVRRADLGVEGQFADEWRCRLASSGTKWNGAVGIYGDRADNPEATNTSETISLSARAAWVPLFSQSKDRATLLHLGAFARYRDDAGGNAASGLHGPSYRYRFPRNTGWGDRFIDTGAAAFAQDEFIGAEFAAQLNAVAVSGEYGHLRAKQESGSSLTGSNPSFQGGFIDVFWSPTGDSRAYKLNDGSFGRLNPHTPLGANGLGVLMSGLRHDFVDLTHGAVDGGQQQGFSLQSTWEPLAFLKFQADYSRLDIERPLSPLSGEADIITLRSQIEW